MFLVYILVIGILIGFDQYTKYLIVSNFSLYEVKEIIKNFFSLTYVQNFGAGFSIMQNQKFFLSAVGVLATFLFVYMLYKSKKNEYLNKVCYILVIAGAIGNLIDRLRLNYVVDFLDFLIFSYDFPVFNLADCYITIGCFLMMISVILEERHAKH